MYDKMIKNIEREIDELKTARRRVTASTSTFAIEIECQCKSTMNSSGTLIPDTYAVITMTPDNANNDNGFIFTTSQDGVQGDGTASFREGKTMSEDGRDYILEISTLSYNGTWNANEQKTITHRVRIVATNTFSYTVSEISYS